VGHEGIHAILLAEDGTAFFVGTPKRGEDGDLGNPDILLYFPADVYHKHLAPLSNLLIFIQEKQEEWPRRVNQRKYPEWMVMRCGSLLVIMERQPLSQNQGTCTCLGRMLARLTVTLRDMSLVSLASL